MSIADVLELSMERPTLSSELAMIGLRTISPEAIRQHKARVIKEQGGHWWKCRYLPASLDELDMPLRLRRRASQAAKLPRVKIVIERHDTDPLLLATRFDWRSFRREVAYIGAWGTGDRELDTF